MTETIIGKDYSRVLVRVHSFFMTRYEIWDAHAFKTRAAAELVNGHYIRNMTAFTCESDEKAKELFYGV